MALVGLRNLLTALSAPDSFPDFLTGPSRIHVMMLKVLPWSLYFLFVFSGDLVSLLLQFVERNMFWTAPIHSDKCNLLVRPERPWTQSQLESVKPELTANIAFTCIDIFKPRCLIVLLSKRLGIQLTVLSGVFSNCFEGSLNLFKFSVSKTKTLFLVLADIWIYLSCTFMHRTFTVFFISW